MKKFLYNLEKWFDLNIGWFFINGHKEEQWYEHLRTKYSQPQTNPE